MSCDFLIELIAQDDHVLELVRQRVLVWFPAEPDLGFPKEAEARALHYFGNAVEAIGTEEDGGAKDALKGSDQPAIFLAAFMHAERFQHFGRSSKPDGLTLLPNRQGGQIDRHDPILTKRQPVVRVTGDLENELAIAPFVDGFALRWFPDRQPAQDEGPGTESQVLFSVFSVQPNEAGSFGLA